MKTFLFLLSALIIWSSDTLETHLNDPSQGIIDKAIEAHGGKNYNPLSVVFDFRDKHYKAVKNGGSYQYERIFTSKEGKQIHDILSNQGFQRKVNGELIKLEPKKERAYSNSVNSVIYFALLPYGLNDEAVKKKYLGTSSINAIDYHKIEVTFQEEGGGDDFSDVFVYWIHPKKFTVDFLGYSYHVNGGGLRFRKAYNQRKIGKIRFQDYTNYKTETKDFTTDQLDSLYVNGKLKELSLIELKKVKVAKN